MKEGFPKDTTRKGASIQKQEKVEIAMKMHIEGYTYAHIARELGVSRECVSKYVKNELADAVSRREDLGDNIVQTELSRLNAVVKLCMRDLEKQEIEWIEDESTGEKVPSTTERLDNYVAATLFKAIEQKAKLLGLYKASKVEHKHEITTIEDLVIQSKPLVIDVVPDVKALTIDEEGQDLDD